MFLPYNVDVPMARIPWANWLLMAVTALASLASLAGWWSEWVRLVKTDPGPGTAAEVRALQGPPAGALRPDHFAPRQLVTHLFVHAGLIHLAVNLLFLFCFGNAVNAKLGQVLFLLLYLLLGALAGAAWLLLGPDTAAVGASGAINGIVGLFVVFFPLNQVQVLYSWGLRRGGGFEMPALVVVGVYFVCDVLGALFNADGGVGYLAHVAGLLGGVTIGVLLAASGLIRSTEYEENVLQVLGLQAKGKG